MSKVGYSFKILFNWFLNEVSLSFLSSSLNFLSLYSPYFSNNSSIFNHIYFKNYKYCKIFDGKLFIDNFFPNLDFNYFLDYFLKFQFIVK